MRPHALYRFFASDDALLYVGITCDVGRRWDRHASDKPWWTEVARSTVQHFDSREAVLAAEEAAIRSEKPRYNVVHNDGAEPQKTKAADPEVARDRLSAVQRQPLLPDSLVGSFFHAGSDRGWQGCVVAEVASEIFLVETFGWLIGDSTDQHLVRLTDMTEWVFYDTAEWMNNAYEYGGVHERWERERAERRTS